MSTRRERRRRRQAALAAQAAPLTQATAVLPLAVTYRDADGPPILTALLAEFDGLPDPAGTVWAQPIDTSPPALMAMFYDQLWPWPVVSDVAGDHEFEAAIRQVSQDLMSVAQLQGYLPTLEDVHV